MDSTIVLASLAAMCSVLLMHERGRSPPTDDAVGASRAGAHDAVEPRALRMTLALVLASIQSGSELLPALCEHVGEDLADIHDDVDARQIEQRLLARRLPEETHAEIVEAAYGLQAAFRVVAYLGCSPLRCVEAVSASCDCLRLREDLRRNAFAVPKSTVKLLMGLPVVTLLLGEVLGAHPTLVLFGSVQGMSMLLLGVMAYATGSMWIKRMFTQFEGRL